MLTSAHKSFSFGAKKLLISALQECQAEQSKHVTGRAEQRMQDFYQSTVVKACINSDLQFTTINHSQLVDSCQSLQLHVPLKQKPQHVTCWINLKLCIKGRRREKSVGGFWRRNCCFCGDICLLPFVQMSLNSKLLSIQKKGTLGPTAIIALSQNALCWST